MPGHFVCELDIFSKQFLGTEQLSFSLNQGKIIYQVNFMKLV